MISKLDPETTKVLPPPDDEEWNSYVKREDGWWELAPDGDIGVNEEDIVYMVNKYRFWESK